MFGKTKVVLATLAAIGTFGAGIAQADTQIPVEIDLTFEDLCIVNNNALSFNNATGTLQVTGQDVLFTAARDIATAGGFTIPEQLVTFSGTVDVVCSNGADIELDIAAEEHTVTVGGEELFVRFSYAADGVAASDFGVAPLAFISDGSAKEVAVTGYVYRKTATGSPIQAGAISEVYNIDITLN